VVIGLKKKGGVEKRKGRLCEGVVGQVRQKREKRNVCMCGRRGRAKRKKRGVCGSKTKKERRRVCM